MSTVPPARWFPVVGLLLGAIYAAAAMLLKGHLPFGVTAVLLVAIDALLTGGLHFDGLADSADGFGGGKTREDALRIMRDHAIGSYGGLALAICVALKTMAEVRGDLATEQLGAGGGDSDARALGRWSMLLLTATLPYARESASVIKSMGKRSLIWGTAAMLLALIASQSIRGWIAMNAALVVTAAFGFYCRRRLRGITGDTLGANLELSECTALLVFLASR